MNTRIRKAELADFDDILKLSQELFDYEEQFKHEYNLHWTYDKAGKNYFMKRLKSNKSLIFVAEENSQVIGYILAFIERISNRRINPICEIENMFVQEQYRGKNVGSRLINEVRKSAKRMGVKLLRVGAIAQNVPAIDFYRSQGFGDVNLFLEEKI